MLRPSSIAKRTAMLDAAARQFLADGYEGVTMDTIAHEAGVAKQTLYSHFGSKESLFTELITQQTAAATERVYTAFPAVSSDTNPHDLLVELMTRQLRTVLQPHLLRLRRLVIAEVSRFPDLAHTLYLHGPHQAIATLAQLIGDLAASKLVLADDPTTAATQLNWMVMGEPLNLVMMLGEQAAWSPVEQEDHVRAAVSAFLLGRLPRK